MPRLMVFLSGLLMAVSAFSQRETVKAFPLHDTMKVVAFAAEVNVSGISSRREVYAGIGTNRLKLVIEAERKDREVEFRFPAEATFITTGIDVEAEKGEMEWDLPWTNNTSYQLLIAAAVDSAAGFSIYSGYIRLPGSGEWKLLGTCKLPDGSGYISMPAAIQSAKGINASVSNAWVQHRNGSWKPLTEVYAEKPVIVPMPNVDSLAQLVLDRSIIDAAIAQEKASYTYDSSGIYYRILERGAGKRVQVDDTVTVRYRLRLFQSAAVIDEAMQSPATFPLNRLIKAWQIALPMVQTGGKLSIVIPSGLAYSIRTRAPKIPPNSILEFEIEVLDAKPPIRN